MRLAVAKERVRWIARRLARAALGPAQFDEVELISKLAAYSDGVMLDVGANVGASLAWFARRNWSVHAFEPDPETRDALLMHLPEHWHVRVDPRAVSAASGQVVPLYTSDVSTGISSLAAFHASHKPTTTVLTVTLRDYMHEQGVESVDFLKVDAEGFDLFVLQGYPWEKTRPRLVLCEFEDRKTQALGYTYHDLGNLLARQGYAVFMSEWHPVVEYGTRHRWLRLARWPTEVLDANAWGNLIAVPPTDQDRLVTLATRSAWRLRLRTTVESVVRPWLERGSESPRV